ncbi:MAG TPA: hypothetical protein VGC74_01740 [Stenotrophomonas sp.]
MNLTRWLPLLLCSTLLFIAGCRQQPDLATYVKGKHAELLDQLDVTEIATSPAGAAVRVKTRQHSTCVVYILGGASQVVKIPELAKSAGCDEHDLVVPNVWLKELNGDDLLVATLSHRSQLRMAKDPSGEWVVTYEGPREEGAHTIDLAVKTAVALAEFQKHSKPQTAAQLVRYLSAPMPQGRKVE